MRSLLYTRLGYSREAKDPGSHKIFKLTQIPFLLLREDISYQSKNFLLTRTSTTKVVMELHGYIFILGVVTVQGTVIVLWIVID